MWPKGFLLLLLWWYDSVKRDGEEAEDKDGDDGERRLGEEQR